jgi:hypothetical protein
MLSNRITAVADVTGADQVAGDSAGGAETDNENGAGRDGRDAVAEHRHAEIPHERNCVGGTDRHRPPDATGVIQAIEANLQQP